MTFNYIFLLKLLKFFISDIIYKYKNQNHSMFLTWLAA